jgi:hypothetical protein
MGGVVVSGAADSAFLEQLRTAPANIAGGTVMHYVRAHDWHAKNRVRPRQMIA